METSTPHSYYQQRAASLSAEKKQQLSRKNKLATLRFLAVIAAFTGAWLLKSEGLGPALFCFLFFISLFIYFLGQDIANNAAIENTVRLAAINEQELAALHHQYFQFDDGKDFLSPVHPYANDLDIFGRASLYQYITRTTSQEGSHLLAGWLTGITDPDVLVPKQEAVKELAAVPGWREQLRSYGMASPVTIATEDKINAWLQEPNTFLQKMGWKIARIVLPLISFTILGLYIAEKISSATFLSSITLMMILAFSISKLVLPAHSRLSRIAPQLGTLSSSVAWIEQLNCQSSYLQQIKTIFDHPSHKASAQIRSLGRILERLDYRLNFVVFIPLNTFLFWDLQQVFALEEWKQNNRLSISAWFKGLAAMEAVSSLGTLSFNHPQWCFPSFSKEDAVIEAEELGHPLLPVEKRVNNSFASSGKGQLSLVTGSNMAGKSTFLRSIGVNMVLAMAGAPVCAQSFSMSPMKVMSSMRISDNLEESTSTFYAELKKLKEIIEAVNRKEKVFLLLDEILRGTNSADRHAGSSALIKQLIHHEASGVLATHDLELAKLSTEFPVNIQNYHFDVQVANEELYFDYKLKRGICQSMNASILMKKIGIEL